MGMQISYSHMGGVDMEHPKRGLLQFKTAGIESMILDFSSVARVSAEKTESLKREAVQPFVEACRSQNMTISLALLPYLPVEREQAVERLYPLLEAAMEACSAYGICTVVVQPPRTDRETLCSFFDQIQIWAEKYGLHVLVKNCPGYYEGRYVRGEFCDPEQTAEWLSLRNRAAGEKRFGFCMDMGICNLCGQDLNEFAAALGSFTEAVLVDECSGEEPGALLPFSAVRRGQEQMDWLNFFRGLRAAEFQGTVILDAKEHLGTVPYLLRQPLLSYAKSAGDYIRMQLLLEQMLRRYPRRVLFGAGRMCRNYMACYGEAYPPLFTCDNNAALWGTQVEGLMVKPPEALLTLPEDCAILLCNVYYEEIRMQLEQMGVKNPIYSFNDEYLRRMWK